MKRVAVPLWYPVLAVLVSVLCLFESVTTYVTHLAAWNAGGSVVLSLPSYGGFEIALAAVAAALGLGTLFVSVYEEDEAPESVPVP